MAWQLQLMVSKALMRPPLNPKRKCAVQSVKTNMRARHTQTGFKNKVAAAAKLPILPQHDGGVRQKFVLRHLKVERGCVGRVGG